MHQQSHPDFPASSPPAGFSARYFFRHRPAEMDELFDTLSCPADVSPDGVYRGRLFAISAVSRLPRPLTGLICRLLDSFLNPWKGKSFGAQEGANIWLSARGSLSFGYYHIRRGEDDNGRALIRLNYAHPRTPRLLQPIRGEARLLTDGVWLARMRWQGRHGLQTLLYFTLEARP